MKNTLNKLGTFLEMIKFEHSIFALPFAYLGLFLATSGWPGFRLFLWVTAAMVTFRTMGMGANRLIDKAIDAANPRTQNRALPAGKLKTPFVWAVTLISFLLFEITAFRLGPLCFFLSPVPLFLAWLYPWLKRFTWLSHFVLGIILGIAPYGAWLAGRPEFSWVPGWLCIGVVTWVAGFDMIYALQDMDFDQKYGLYSFPARFGKQMTLAVTRILHGVTLFAWLMAGLSAHLGLPYMIGIAVVAFFLIREHWLIRSFGLKKMGEAFFAMNAYVSVSIFLAVLMDLSWRKWIS